MILVDTSVWIDHLRRRNNRLESLLHQEQVICHPLVIGELACGNLKNRTEILGLLAALPQTYIAEHGEVLHLLDTHRLYDCGLGWIDVHLLASAFLTRCNFWTLDKPLQATAERLKLTA